MNDVTIFHYGEYAYRINEFGISEININKLKNYSLNVAYGKIRKDEKVAEKALKLQIIGMRLHALAEQLGGLREYDEKDGGWIVRYDPLNEKGQEWEYTFTHKFHPEKVYMTEECSKRICEMLNSGEFSLDTGEE